MEIQEIKNDVKERQFLIKALSFNNIGKEEYDARMKVVEERIARITSEKLKEVSEKLTKDMKEKKKEIQYDGNLKRAIATLLIDFLKADFEETEIKGIMRQGYKLMRLRC